MVPKGNKQQLHKCRSPPDAADAGLCKSVLLAKFETGNSEPVARDLMLRRETGGGDEERGKGEGGTGAGEGEHGDGKEWR